MHIIDYYSAQVFVASKYLEGYFFLLGLFKYGVLEQVLL